MLKDGTEDFQLDHAKYNFYLSHLSTYFDGNHDDDDDDDTTTTTTTTASLRQV